LVTNATTATSSNNSETEPKNKTEENPPIAKSRLSINNEENQQSDSRSETIDPQPGPSASQDLFPEHGHQQPEHCNQQPENGDQLLENGDELPENDDQQPEHDDQKPKNGDQLPENDDQRPEHDDQQPEHGDRQPDAKDNWLGEENNHSEEKEHQSDQDDLGNNESSDREKNNQHHHQEVEEGHFLQKLGDFADSLQREEEERSEAPVGLPDPEDAIIPPDDHWAEPSGQVEGDTAAGAGPTAYAVYSYIIGLQQQKLEEPSEEPYGLPNPDDALLEPANKKRKMLCGDSRAEGEAAD